MSIFAFSLSSFLLGTKRERAWRLEVQQQSCDLEVISLRERPSEWLQMISQRLQPCINCWLDSLPSSRFSLRKPEMSSQSKSSLVGFFFFGCCYLQPGIFWLIQGRGRSLWCREIAANKLITEWMWYKLMFLKYFKGRWFLKGKEGSWN